MRIYKFPVMYDGKGNPTEFQPIDLDYIVSIGPIFPVTYTGSSIGESHAYFMVHIKIGQPLLIAQYSGDIQRCPDSLIDRLNKERLYLIQSWEKEHRSDDPGTFKKEELHIFKEWFNHIHDTAHPDYLETKDFLLLNKVTTLYDIL